MKQKLVRREPVIEYRKRLLPPKPRLSSSGEVVADRKTGRVLVHRFGESASKEG